MPIIRAEGVSIRYITGDFKDIGLKEYVLRKLTGNYQVKEFWADWDVTFELEKGDMLGIVGTNGAGKSTLLKAISGIMVPTRGKIQTNGTVAALLELTSGFDGDLTVRENTYLRGALLGYTRAFMDQMYDEIISFAELQDFQERPFKQLSSGMKSRLAFSIASLVNPDILILDEVLSVGDGSFRQKSGNKMREILANGVTGILVSHSIDQVRTVQQGAVAGSRQADGLWRNAGGLRPLRSVHAEEEVTCRKSISPCISLMQCRRTRCTCRCRWGPRGRSLLAPLWITRERISRRKIPAIAN